jgi:peptide deformylase
MPDPLHIVFWPDPRLRAACATVTDFGPALQELIGQMFELMRAQRGVGLAAPQVGRNIRLFVMNHSGDPAHDRVYVNPVLTHLDGTDTDEEGCLSIPDVRINVPRTVKLQMTAQAADGSPIDAIAEGFEARVWQHEVDHLLGILLTDRMSFTDKMRWRKKLKLLETNFAERKRA